MAFHPKTYIFVCGDQGEVYVGSSNISNGGLVDGIDGTTACWLSEVEDYHEFLRNFDHLFAQARPLDGEWLKIQPLLEKTPLAGPSLLAREERPHPTERRSRPCISWNSPAEKVSGGVW